MIDKDIIYLNLLFVEALKKGKIMRFPLYGLSMYPTLREGDILKIKPISYQEARIGDILASYNFESRKILVHRLVKKIKNNKSDFMLTMAEAVPPLYYDLPINPNNCIIAKVIAIERGKQLINLETKWAHFCSRIRACFLVNLPFIIKIHKVSIKAIETPHLIPKRLIQIFKKIIDSFYKIRPIIL